MHRNETGHGGLERVAVDSPLCEGHVYRHGAHVTHFRPRGSAPVLWVSGRSRFADGVAIRGGVPICFPWFAAKGDDPSAPAHGPVRTRAWELVSIDELDGGAVRVSLDTEAAGFLVTQTVTFGRSLVMRLGVYNRAAAPATFEAALHTYLSVGDVRRVEVDGLGGARYIDKVRGGAAGVQGAEPLTIGGETDRVYLDTDATVAVRDPALARTLCVEKSGSRSTVVWNPWAEKAARIPDFGDGQWSQMLCVETANIGPNAVTLGPGRSHTMTATLGVDVLR